MTNRAASAIVSIGMPERASFSLLVFSARPLEFAVRFFSIFKRGTPVLQGREESRNTTGTFSNDLRGSVCRMNIVVQVKLEPDARQVSVLESTLYALNEQANKVSEVAFDRDVKRNYDLRKLTYNDLREAGIGSQAAQHIIKKVCNAYVTLKANIKAGNLGTQGSQRRVKAESKPISFRLDSAHPYDARNLSFALEKKTISLWTLEGRMKNIPFTGSEHDLAKLARFKRGDCDLMRRDGMWLLAVTVDIPDTERYEPTGFIGVDLGIVNVATASSGYTAAGRGLNRHRKRQIALRAKLQAKQTKAAKRRLKARARKEARHVKNINHCISKTIVTEAKRTGRGISLEELKGIRDRVRLRKPERVTLHSWSFDQLGQFIVYKATMAGVPVVYVDPAYTSQMCAECGYTDKNNRVSHGSFTCRSCGHAQHADRNASRNIAQRGNAVWNAGRESRVPVGA